MKKTGILVTLLFIGLANLYGQSWDTTKLKDLNHGAYNDIVFANANHGFIIGDSNIFLESKDAGKTWIGRTPIENFPNPNRARNKDYKQIVFLNDTVGFMRSAHELFQTKDAGETWKAILNGTGGVIIMSVFKNKLSVFSDEAFGTLLTSVYSEDHDTFSYNGGGFFPVYFLEKIIRLNDSIMITAKDSGKIFLYNSKTKTLTKTYDPANDGLANLKTIDLFFLNKDTGFASFNYILLKKTTDGGKTWFTDTSFPNSVIVKTTKVFSWANGELYLNSVNFQGTNFFHKYNSVSQQWEQEALFISKNLGYGHNNYAGIAGNGNGLFTVFENDILGYKTEWNYIKSIKKPAQNLLQVFPNPSNGKIWIKNSSNNQESTCTVYDVRGRQIKTLKLNSLTTELNLKNKGIYFLTLKEGGIILGHSKLIIQ